MEQGQKRWTSAGVAALLRARTNLNPDTMFSTQEIAERWGLEEVTIRRWIVAGKLPGGNLGSAKRPLYRVRLADLLAYELNTGLPTNTIPNLGPGDVS